MTYESINKFFQQIQEEKIFFGCVLTVWAENLLIFPSETLTDSKKVLIHSKPLSVKRAGSYFSIFSRNSELCVSGCMSPKQEANHWKQHWKRYLKLSGVTLFKGNVHFQTSLSAPQAS